MAFKAEQIERPSWLRPQNRKRSSFKAAKVAYNRYARHQAKRDPEGAPRKRELNGWWW